MDFKAVILWFRNTMNKAIDFLKDEKVKMMLLACLCATVIVGLGMMKNDGVAKRDTIEDELEGLTGGVVSDTCEADNNTQSEKVGFSNSDGQIQPEQSQDIQYQIIDLSDVRMDLETKMLQINEPTPYGRELLYSAGSASSIDGPVLTKLFLYNIDTREENQIAETKVKFGEIYEGRFNADWIVWLDTNQSGTNYIYALNRKTGKVFQVKRCDLNKPQLVLYGDNLVWVEQKDEQSDRLYLYNLKSGEPIVLDSFNNPTYGTCPPALYNDILVWTYLSPEDHTKSIIKKLDLKEILTVGQATGQDVAAGPNEGQTSKGSDIELATDMEQKKENESDKAGNISAEIKDMGVQNKYSNDHGITKSFDEDQGIEFQIIDPKGFAIYPQTNGEVIAWLDNLDPSKARLLMTRDDGKTIQVVAQGVGRLFGVGDKFIVYTQNDSIMLYFWEINRYARLTKPGEKGMLSKACVSGNVVVWYDINDPTQRKDKVKISIIEQPSI